MQPAGYRSCGDVRLRIDSVTAPTVGRSVEPECDRQSSVKLQELGAAEAPRGRVNTRRGSVKTLSQLAALSWSRPWARPTATSATCPRKLLVINTHTTDESTGMAVLLVTTTTG